MYKINTSAGKRGTCTISIINQSKSSYGTATTVTPNATLQQILDGICMITTRPKNKVTCIIKKAYAPALEKRNEKDLRSSVIHHKQNGKSRGDNYRR